jgi:hypothetical protein
MSSIAQGYKQVNTFIHQNKWEEAKAEIDKLTLEPEGQNKADTWYYKSRVYAALIKEVVALKKYPTLISDAEAAVQKLISLDPTFVQIKEKGPDAIFDLYSYGFNNGIRTFNVKNWDSSCVYFAIAVTYSDILFKNKLIKGQTRAFDTTSIEYAGYSGQYASKPEFALKYYSRLADAKISYHGYLDIYKYLLTTYLTNKNDTDFRKYLAISRSVFPNEPWNKYVFEYAIGVIMNLNI